MGYEDLRIRDLSRVSEQWTPPISALGGPPAHELYADLVVHAGLQLMRDVRSRPWVILRDGAQRRAFPAPSAELRSALDRFRMRRNLRPVPENDIEEFVRIVEARTSDPDVAIPTLRSPVIEQTMMPVRPTPAPMPSERTPAFQDPPALPTQPALSSLDGPERPAHDLSDPPVPLLPQVDLAAVAPALTVSGEPLNSSVSGARGPTVGQDPTLARYVRVFRELVRERDWMGTTQELSKLTRDDPFSMYDSLLRFRSELAENNVLVTNVEVGGVFQWLAVDRTRVGNVPTESPRTIPRLFAR